MPFSHDAFLDVFGAYNTQCWPAAVLLWLATAATAWQWLLHGGVSRRVLFWLLAAHWAWSGVAYHWGYFRAINPAATWFGALFVVQAVLFVREALGPKAQVGAPSGRRGVISAVLVIYGLLYPGVGAALGLEYPRLPLFAVPCPTTLVTAGFLVAASGVPRAASVLPLLWAAVGSVAAFALGIRADLALVGAAAILLLDVMAPQVLGPRR